MTIRSTAWHLLAIIYSICTASAVAQACHHPQGLQLTMSGAAGRRMLLGCSSPLDVDLSSQRADGKAYVVKDGDVRHFLHS